jgi:GAF domain-containing protein
VVGADRFIDPVVLERSLSALREQAGRDGLMDALQHMLDATRQLFSASGAGFMMLDGGSALSAVAATDAPGRLLEERQERVGHGPCVDCLTLDQVVTTQDLAADDRWPQLLPELPDAGVRAVLGVPMRTHGVALGALNVYRSQPHAWDDSEIAALESYGTVLEGLLRTALESHQRERLAQQLQHALDNRVPIERAVGVIMARESVDPVTAFNELRRRARSAERKVADVATELLDSVAADA